MTGMLDVTDRCRRPSSVRRNCKGGGRFTSRCGDAGAICRCGASTCSVLATREVPKMNTIERFVVAGFVAPRLRAGTFPRKVKVVDASGVVTREITGEDLGRELLKRAEIECSSPVPPTVCPRCGGHKTRAEAKLCRGCAGNLPNPDKHKCSGCGKHKSKAAKMCATCAGYAENPELHTCPACGERKCSEAKHCRKCSYSLRSKATMGCPVCGGKKRKSRQVTCGECRGKLPRKAAKTRCACGGRKDPKSNRCARCREAEVGVGDAEMSRAIDAYNAGASLASVADILGRRRTAAARLMRSMGVTIRRGGFQKRSPNTQKPA